MINMIDLGMNVQATADAARFDHDQLSDTAGLDTGLMSLVGQQLAGLGHKVVLARGQSGVYRDSDSNETRRCAPRSCHRAAGRVARAHSRPTVTAAVASSGR